MKPYLCGDESLTVSVVYSARTQCRQLMFNVFTSTWCIGIKSNASPNRRLEIMVTARFQIQKVKFRRLRYEITILLCTEPVLLNVYGAPELIPRNEFRQPIQPGGPVRKPYSSLVPSPHRLFKNSSSVHTNYKLCMGIGCQKLEGGLVVCGGSVTVLSGPVFFLDHFASCDFSSALKS